MTETILEGVPRGRPHVLYLVCSLLSSELGNGSRVGLTPQRGKGGVGHVWTGSSICSLLTSGGFRPQQHRYLHNRAENSYQPTRQRERRMPRCKAPGHAQRFLS